jgi:hypothetical protein
MDGATFDIGLGEGRGVDVGVLVGLGSEVTLVEHALQVGL